jgi:hypothetical protein
MNHDLGLKLADPPAACSGPRGRRRAGHPAGGEQARLGFSPTASQSLAEIAAMQEAGVPVTYG